MVQERVVVAMHPGLGRFGGDEAEAQGAHAPLACLADRLDVRAGDPERRVRLLERLGHDVPGREIEMLAVEFPTLVREHRDDGAHRLLPAVALVAPPDVEQNGSASWRERVCQYV